MQLCWFISKFSKGCLVLLCFSCSILAHNMHDFPTYHFSLAKWTGVFNISESYNSIAKSYRSVSSGVQPDIDESTTWGFWCPTSKENSHVAHVHSWREEYLHRRIMGQLDIKVQSDKIFMCFHFLPYLWNLSIEESLFLLLIYTYMAGNSLRNPEKITPFFWCFHLEFTVIDSL